MCTHHKIKDLEDLWWAATGKCPHCVRIQKAAPVPDTLEDVALRLQQFAAAADVMAAQGVFPNQVQIVPPRTGPKTPIQQVYENCVGALTDDERRRLRRMIEKMSSGLGGA